MADAFAEQGYACLVLDLFNGDPAPLNMPEDFDIMGWITKGTDGKNPHLPENIDPIVVAGIKYMQEVVGAKQLAGVGYCFGAKVSPNSFYEVRCLANTDLEYLVRHYQDGIKCGFIAHPSFVESQEVAAITGPLSIAAAEHDDIFPPEKRQESETILGETGKPFQINLFSAVEHGFAVRGNVENKSERFAKEQAFQQAVTWFDNWLCE